MKAIKVIKGIGTVCQILGAVGGITMAAFEIGEGVNKLKSINDNDSNVNDSIAPETEVEA